jgi:hypothetical protein
MPDVVESPAYDPDVFEVHKVTTNGTIKFEKRYFSVSRALTGENVGLRYLGESRWVGHYIKMLPPPASMSWDAATRIGAPREER